MDILQIVIPWVFALITLIFSFYSLRVSSRNSNLDRMKVVLSGNRQEWINNLRNTVAELLSVHENTGLFQRIDFAEYKDEIKVNMQKIGLLQHKIQLLLNPNEKDSKLLIEKIWLLNSASKGTQEEMDDKYYVKIQDEIISITQRILKTEWERVKKIE